MFEKCQIEVIQNFQNSNAAHPKWIIFELLRARMVTILGVDQNLPEASDGTIWQYIKQQNETIQYWGRWKRGINSLAGNTFYSIGMAAPADQYWTFSHVHRTLNFIERVRWTNAAADDVDFVIPLTLYEASISQSGIDPMASRRGNRSQGFGPTLAVEGTGRAYAGSGNYVVPGPVTWLRHLGV